MNLPKERDQEDYDDEEDEELEAPAKKSRKAKAKDTTLRGRFAKTSSDEESDADDSDDESDPDAEGWGRSYYSRPSTRREREDDQLTGEDAERREEERELELNEVKRLQRKLRQGIRGEDDWGLDDLTGKDKVELEEKGRDK